VKGLILSGGAGTRLRPITHTNAKQLVPIANKPILFYGIEGLAKSGITEIGIIIGETGDEVREAVGDGSRWGVKVTYIPQHEPLGLAHCVRIARDFLAEEDFVMYLGDNMLQQSLSQLVENFRADRINSSLKCRILLKRVSDPSAFGVAIVNEQGQVVELIEKPEEPPSDLALVGVYFFSSSIHQAVASIEPSVRGEYEITDAIQGLIEQGIEVDFEELQGWWIDTGKKDPLLECNRLVLATIVKKIHASSSVDSTSQLRGKIQIGENSTVSDSVIEGPVVLGDNVIVKGCKIGPNVSIGDHCSLVSSAIDNSVLLKGCVVVQAGCLSSSLLGRSSKVSGTSANSTSSLMLGDDSIVEFR
jgi:glucose-1-phosphate thymidylyltransferase